VFGSLVKLDADLQPVPDIAEDIEVSTDVKTYTFRLKQNMTFTDGQPLTAKDVVFTIERAVDNRTGSYWQGRLLAIEGADEYSDQRADTIAGLETPDDFTVVMNLVAPDSTWLLTISDFAGLGILPAHVLQDIPPDELQQHPFSLNPDVTAGVFTFTDYETDQFVELTRNENYGGDKAKLDKVFFKILTPDVAIAQLETGEIDVSSVPVAELERLTSNPDLSIVSVPSPSVDFLTLNLTKPYFQDKRVRQAMMYALDREAVVDAIFAGEATVVNQSIIGPDWMGNPDVNPYSFDPDQAKQLLAEANWDSGLTVELIYVPGTKSRDAYIPIIQQQLTDVGMKVELRPMESAEYTRRRNTDHDFDIAVVGGGVFRQDPNVSAKYFETKNFVPGGANYSHYSNPRVDELFEAGRATTDLTERKTIYTEVATILNDEVPWVFLWSPNSIFAHTNRLVGFDPPSYVNTPMWNADDWTVTDA
jgi:peptide/nickel transport system substrate-binding protein